MTNKTERYYVVSEDQLVVLGIENRNYGFNVSVDQVNDWMARIKKAEAACRAREVPEWATHFVEFPAAPHGEGYRIAVQRHEEIKK